MQGVTAAIVGFIFVCIVYPHLVKNRPQFYGALAAILLVILLDSLAQMIPSVVFHNFAGAFEGLLQVCAILLLVLCAGGLTVRDLAEDVGKQIDVIRRGGEKETIIVPLSGDRPRPKYRDVADPAVPLRPRAEDSDNSIPLE